MENQLSASQRQEQEMKQVIKACYGISILSFCFLHNVIKFRTIVMFAIFYTRKNACSVTAFNSTDIRSVQDNVATPVTAVMVTVCISTDALSSVFISPDLSDTNSFHQCRWSIMPVTACSYRLQQSVPNIPVSFCYIRLIQP